MTAVRFHNVADLSSSSGLAELLGPIDHVERQAILSGGFSGSRFERVTLVLKSGATKRFMVKRTVLAEDWLSQRTGDAVGREAALVGEPTLSPVWECFACPYVAYAMEEDAIGLLMQDLSAHLLPDERQAVAIAVEDVVANAMTALHAAFWTRDELSMPWLLQPADYVGMMGPGEHEEDGWAPPPAGIHRAMRDGWAVAMNELPARVVQRMLRPAGELVEEWSSLPRTLLHGDMKIANLAVLPDQRVAAIDWAFVGYAPCTFELGWYLAVNATRLARPKDHYVALYRHLLEKRLGGKIDDRLWHEMILAGIVCGAMMLLWTKGNALRGGRSGAREEWNWWLRHLEYWGSRW